MFPKIILLFFFSLQFLQLPALEQVNIPVSYERCFLSEKASNEDFEKNPAISKKIKKVMRPFVIDDDHPMKLVLDNIFMSARVTLDAKTFKANGFKIISRRPRSYVCVATHPLLPNYIIKAYLDTERREKRETPSWKWLVRRCEGAEKIRDIIKKKKIKNFVVAEKCIYPLPARPSPPDDFDHTRHLAILLATDMDLAPADDNYYAWANYITEEHLDELYTIITYAKGSSYRPDNICYTNQGLFAFIDTEYPSEGPDYKSIRRHLNSKMRSYWDYLVKTGKK
jgi:hypothetical protein